MKGFRCYLPVRVSTGASPVGGGAFVVFLSMESGSMDTIKNQ